MSELADSLDRRVDGIALDGAAAEALLAVSDALYADFRLRRALSDPSVDAEHRGQVVRALFGEKIPPATTEAMVEIASDALSGRDLETSAERQAVRAVLRNSPNLDETQDQFFKIARMIEGNHELQARLTDPLVELDARKELLTSLLAGRGTDQVVSRLAIRAVEARHVNLIKSLDWYVRLAGEIKSHRIAVVTVAAELSPEQHARLSMQLNRIYGGGIDIEQRIDPDMIGGVRIQIDNDLIDGSVERKIAQARLEIGG